MNKTQQSVAAILAAMPCAAVAQDSRPNVVIIYTDDHGTLDANCFGAECRV